MLENILLIFVKPAYEIFLCFYCTSVILVLQNAVSVSLNEFLKFILSGYSLETNPQVKYINISAVKETARLL